ncbi:MAG: Cache 3/Cache 2 fusion domain-containing protein, partial [Deltaproteobacteria bacterium]|nr:Cache 3/Cache 2 fusion domain-containing protein [Deltaproteobacteria bacterium]
MIIPRFRNLRIRAKLVTVTLFLVLVPLLCVAYLAMDRFGKALRGAAEEDLEHLVRNIYSMCKIHREIVQREVGRNIRVARHVLARRGQIRLFEDEKIHFTAVDPFTLKKALLTIPLLKAGDTPLTGDTSFVEEVRKLTGGTCGLYQRIREDRFLCISSTLKDIKGRQITGTILLPDSPAVQALLSGNPYRGRARISGEWYLTAYDPILGPGGSVIGAFSVGVKEQGTESLKAEIRGIRVGKTGYAYIMDSSGVLKIHPAKEGENIIHSKDSSGFEYIRAMIQESIHLPQGAVGTIRYPWVNPELGETEPRQKITKYMYFKPWGWIIAAGTYEEEIYQDLSDTERFIGLMVLLGVVLVLFLTLSLSKVLTRPIQELTEVTTRMVEGDLSQRVKVRGGDEIGVLGTSFNRMISQIQHYTSNLEKMVDARTRELKESRERYRELTRFLNSILDSATEYAIIAVDFHGTIMEFNKGAEKLFGWKKDDVLHKKNITITLTPEDVARGMPAIMSKRARSEGICELEMIRIRKGNEYFPAHTSVTAIKDPDGRTTGFLEIIRDLTRRKSLEKELRETKEFLENIMESSVDGIVTTDLKGKITYLNRAMEEMIQYRREEILGQHISTVYVRGIQEARDIMALLKARERAENYEMEVKRKDGEILVIQNSLFLVRDEEGKLVGTAGIFKDVTEKKRLEAKLKAAQVRLVEASKMRALGELVAGVAHELNNPLMASKTILHVILKNIKEECRERERLELIKKCNDRIERIVEHLREFSRQTKPRFQELDVNLPIENALMITGQQLLNHGIAIERKLSNDLPRIWGDSNQLEQVFLNLISNARDAMDEAEGNNRKLTIVSTLVEEENKPWVLVSVRDTGVGIPRENLDKILEPFFTTKPVGKGTGLGLSLCFGIVETHGGRIEVESELGLGTEVKIYLPVYDP